MKFGISINIRNYESLKFESSEYPFIYNCIDEITTSLEKIKGLVPEVTDKLNLLNKMKDLSK